MYLPLYEAKMLQPFNHRWGDYAMRVEGNRSNELPNVPLEKLQDPSYQVTPNHWVPEIEVKLRCANLPKVMIEAFRKGQNNVIVLGLVYWAFGQWLRREASSSASLAMANLFDYWVKFNQGFQWANAIAPTQLGLCPDGEALIHPQGPSFIPALPINELLHDGNHGPCWYEAKRAPLERLIQTAEDHPLTDEEWVGLQVADDGVSLARWILERRTPKWLAGWRRSGRGGDTRTLLPALLPRAGVGDSFFLIEGLSQSDLAACLIANLSSFICDFVVRQKAGGPNLSFFVMSQIAILPPETYEQSAPWSPTQTVREWMAPRVLELLYTSWDLQPYAIECHFEGPPFVWDEERRFQIRCELDAAFFRLYGLTKDEVGYVMDTFSVVRRKEEAEFGSYRTKEVILSKFEV